MISLLARLAVLAAILCTASGCAWFREAVPDKLPLYSARAESGDLLAGAALREVHHDVRPLPRPEKDRLERLRPIQQSAVVSDQEERLAVAEREPEDPGVGRVQDP